MATPSQSRSSERLREETRYYASRLQHRGLLVVSIRRGQGSKLEARTESIHPEIAGAIPETYNKIPVVKFNARKTRPQEPGRPRPPTAQPRQHALTYGHPMVQNVLPHRDLWSPHGAECSLAPSGTTSWEKPPNKPPIGSISKRLDDMLSTPFCSYIIHYEPQGIPRTKIFHIQWVQRSFDHIIHYQQLMTLDIGNDALLCKVFPASLQGQTLSWFHRLPPNSVDNFKDLSEAFVGQYLCSARHKQNISTLQNIKIRDIRILREFVKRFGQAVLQVESCQYGCYPTDL
ncbi:hypothetical protein CK203_000656 [Vitis vinifera]|uniref:Retrotransposon gag domain-containing protein n=1 Tax=Vitis vinifera TaxID=29760 RepID=A0A438KRQ9_VITVI|nr:hypothetical protein CK203_000656 [Vitis vinifera]